ncbi:MAG: D-alanine--D-alanine ligase [Spirochaetes bacterium]|nr:D-alanine--D-alanine ligase [Spirochaetota bacterium]
MLNVAILFGGKSGEFEVSRCSAASVFKAIDASRYKVSVIAVDRDGKWYPQKNPQIIKDDVFGEVLSMEKNGEWSVNHYSCDSKLVLRDFDTGERLEYDLVFPVMHGTNCEDGKLQGLLELASVPYVGADVLGSSVGMDKDAAKRLLKEAGIPVVPWIAIDRNGWNENAEFLIQEIKMEFDFPFFVKPANAGSSVGIYKIKNDNELTEKINLSFQYDTKILIEKAINCKEIECAVLGNYNPECSVAGEIIPAHEFYSYEAKYVDKNGASMKIPAEIPAETAEKIRYFAIEGYKKLCLSGMARIDFFLDTETMEFYLNEVNTLPGFTSISMYPKLWEYSGLPYRKLIDKLISLSLERHSHKNSLKTEM